jgi:hypothetical protein
VTKEAAKAGERKRARPLKRTTPKRGGKKSEHPVEKPVKYRRSSRRQTYGLAAYPGQPLIKRANPAIQKTGQDSAVL